MRLDKNLQSVVLEGECTVSSFPIQPVCGVELLRGSSSVYDDPPFRNAIAFTENFPQYVMRKMTVGFGCIACMLQFNPAAGLVK